MPTKLAQSACPVTEERIRLAHFTGIFVNTVWIVVFTVVYLVSRRGGNLTDVQIDVLVRCMRSKWRKEPTAPEEMPS